MYWSKSTYLTGRYGESPEGFLSIPNTVLLAETLAWAAKSKIPFQDVLASLMDYGRPVVHLFWNDPVVEWEKALWRAKYDLEFGFPLFMVLRRRFSRYLPEYYLQAVEKAEKDGRLEEVLPHFATRLRFSAEMKAAYFSSLRGSFLELFIIGSLSFFMGTFLLPKYSRILHDLGLAYWYPSFYAVIESLSYISMELPFYFLCAVIAVVVLFILKKILRGPVSILQEEIFIRIPFFRRQYKDIARLELAASFASYISAGEDILDAAKFTRKACRHFWYRKNIDRFIERVSRGEDWLDAWNGLCLHDPFCEWLVRNAASRDNVVEGFDSMNDWLLRRVVSTAGKNMFYLFLAGVLVNALVVAVLALMLFGSFIKIIEMISATIWI